MRTAYVEVRSQHSRGSRVGGFGGPDRYVAVQVVPEGAERMATLNRKTAALRGIELIYVGEGYSNRRGPRSMLGKAICEAREIAGSINQEAFAPVS